MPARTITVSSVKSASPTCCATLNTIDAGDAAFTPGFKHLLKRALAIGRRRDALKDSTLVQYRADLDRRLGLN